MEEQDLTQSVQDYQQKNQPILKEQQLVAKRIKAPNGMEIKLKPLEFMEIQENNSVEEMKPQIMKVIEEKKAVSPGLKPTASSAILKQTKHIIKQVVKPASKKGKLEPKDQLTEEEEEDEDEDEISKQQETESSDNDSYWFTSGEEESDEEDDHIPYKQERMVMFASYCHYDVIKEVSKFTFEYHLTKKEYCNWDIWWSDGPITIQLLKRMQSHQRVNHFPGIYNLAKKNMLGRHLMRMKNLLPEEYNFFPGTYNLPHDYKELMAQHGDKRNRTYIVKPEASCQGKGIFLTRNPELLTAEKVIIKNEFGKEEGMVVQRYMAKPFLIDGFKFDLRLYVLIVGINPLRCYLYKDGLARFATVQYQTPNTKNLDNMCMHLTNYAINKESDDFIVNNDEERDDIGSKRSFAFVLQYVADNFGQESRDLLVAQIKDILIKTLCMAQPHVHHLYRSSQPDDIENSMCYQLLGFDIMIDKKLVPQLIEVNQMPSFQTDSPLDYKIKKGVINDTIALLNLSISRRNRVKNQKKQEMQRRLFKGYSLKPVQINQTKVAGDQTEQKKHTQSSCQLEPFSPLKKDNKQSVKEQMQQSKEYMRKKKRLLREKHELALQGQFELIYPVVSYFEEDKIRETIELLSKESSIKKSQECLKIMKDIEEQAVEEVANELLGLGRFGEETGEEDDQQGGVKPVPVQETPLPNLQERWKIQNKYESFMETARIVWETFTGGSLVTIKRKERIKLQKQEEERKAKEERDKVLHKREIARKNLTIKQKKWADERKLHQLEREKVMAAIVEEQNQINDTDFANSDSGDNESIEKSDTQSPSTLKMAKDLQTGDKKRKKKRMMNEGKANLSDESDYAEKPKTSPKNRLTVNMIQDANFDDVPIQDQKTRPTKRKLPHHPNMDYYKHIRQKYKDKQDQIKKQSQEGPTSVTQIQTLNIPKPDSKLNIKTDNTRTKLAQSTQESVAIQRFGNVQALKPKASEFPLDHFFPVFNNQFQPIGKKDHLRKANTHDDLSTISAQTALKLIETMQNKQYNDSLPFEVKNELFLSGSTAHVIGWKTNQIKPRMCHVGHDFGLNVSHSQLRVGIAGLGQQTIKLKYSKANSNAKEKIPMLIETTKFNQQNKGEETELQVEQRNQTLQRYTNAPSFQPYYDKQLSTQTPGKFTEIKDRSTYQKMFDAPQKLTTNNQVNGSLYSAALKLIQLQDRQDNLTMVRNSMVDNQAKATLNQSILSGKLGELVGNSKMQNDYMYLNLKIQNQAEQQKSLAKNFPSPDIKTMQIKSAQSKIEIIEEKSTFYKKAQSVDKQMLPMIAPIFNSLSGQYQHKNDLNRFELVDSNDLSGYDLNFFKKGTSFTKYKQDKHLSHPEIFKVGQILDQELLNMRKNDNQQVHQITSPVKMKGGLQGKKLTIHENARMKLGSQHFQKDE